MGGTTLKSAASWNHKHSGVGGGITAGMGVKCSARHLDGLHQAPDLLLVQQRRDRPDHHLQRDIVNFRDVARVDRPVVVFIPRPTRLSGHFRVFYTGQSVNLHPCYRVTQKTQHETTLGDVVVNESTLPGYLCWRRAEILIGSPSCQSKPAGAKGHFK